MVMNRWFVLFAILFSWGCTPADDAPVQKIITEISHSTEPVGLFETKLTSYWPDPPTVKVCPGAGVSVERVRYAIRFWERLGYSFGPVIEAPRIAGYPCQAYIGEIVFRSPTQQELSDAVATHRLGVTKTSFDRASQQIIMSEIYFQTQVASHRQKIVEHELGHALGWRHHNRSSHIMHSNLDETGLSATGVSREDYDSRIADILADNARREQR